VILAGDIGGTTTRIACFEVRKGLPGPPVDMELLQSARFPSIEALVQDFLSRRSGKIDAAAFGIAGAVVDGVVHVTNLPWNVKIAALEKTLGLRCVHLVNDLVAAGYGIELLGHDDLIPLQAAKPSDEYNAGLLSAGTGLGETILVRVNGRFLPVPSETGHTDYSPRTDDELRVFRAFRARFGRVSWERVVSGPGLVALGAFFHEERGALAEWKRHLEEAGEGGAAGVVSRLGMERSCPACEQALRLFVGAYGAESGNMALRAVARSGIYLGGGIAPRILPALRWPEYVDSHRDYAKSRHVLKHMHACDIRGGPTIRPRAARYACMASRGLRSAAPSLAGH